MIILIVILYLVTGFSIANEKDDNIEIVMWLPHLVMYCINILINKLDR
jgi:lipopolysaccharide export LptBFGC system permease protein LptF